MGLFVQKLHDKNSVRWEWKQICFNQNDLAELHANHKIIICPFALPVSASSKTMTDVTLSTWPLRPTDRPAISENSGSCSMWCNLKVKSELHLKTNLSLSHSRPDQITSGFVIAQKFFVFTSTSTHLAQKVIMLRFKVHVWCNSQEKKR